MTTRRADPDRLLLRELVDRYSDLSLRDFLARYTDTVTPLAPASTSICSL